MGYIKLFDDTDDIMEAWLDLFLQVADQHVPIKQHRVKHKNQPQWLSPEILEAMKCRDRHKSLDNDDEYKVWRNKVIKMIQHAKKVQYRYINFSWNSLKNKPGNLHIIPNQQIIFQDPSLSAFREILLTRSK